jgi:threonine synthase
VRAAMEVAGAAYEIEPSLIAVQKVLKEGALSA